MKTRVHVFITGRVQGVFFRSRTTSEARQRGVAGWVKNLVDGGVEAVFEGEKEDVEEMIKFCKRGPPRAFVQNVEIQCDTYTGEFRDFTVIY